MRNIILYILVLTSSLLYCQNKFEKNYLNLQSNIVQYLESKTYNSNLFDSIVENFKINEENLNNSFYYPTTEIDYKNIWNFVNKLFRECESDHRYILLYLKLESIQFRNVELGEKLSFDFYNVALKSPLNIVKALKVLNEDQQNILLNNLGMLIEFNKVDEFINSLSEINSQDYIETISKITKHFNIK